MVIRLEQGLFNEPPPDLLVKIGFRLDANLEELLREYFQYIKDTRAIFREKHSSFKSILRTYDLLEDIHPLVYYREAESLSRIGLCKELCLHQDPIRDYENNQQRGLPAQLIAASEEIGWDYHCVEIAVKSWRVKWH